MHHERRRTHQISWDFSGYTMKMIAVLVLAACVAASMADTPCPDMACTLELNPQCATFVGMFDNPCRLQAAKCQLGKLGLYLQTSSTGKCDCLRPCTANYLPVCGSDGKTYSNACDLDTAICKGKRVGEVSSTACP